MPRTHWNALHDPQIPPDAKKQVRCNVSLRALSGIRTDAKTQVWRNVSRRSFVEFVPVPAEHEK
jgi:hypothetical protein